MKVLSPSRRRMAVMHVRQTLFVSVRRTCRVIGQHRSTQRKRPQGKVDEELLTADIIKLASGGSGGQWYDHFSFP